MNRRYMIYTGLIAVLVAGNLARSWLAAPTNAAQGSAPTYSQQEFRIRGNLPAESEVRRNLFSSEPTIAAPRPIGATPLVRPERSLLAPVQTAAQSAVQTEAAVPTTSGLDRLGLLGVVFRNGQGQAYLAVDKKPVVVHSGEMVFGQFTVENILVDAVEVRDLKTNAVKRIPVSGK